MTMTENNDLTYEEIKTEYENLIVFLDENHEKILRTYMEIQCLKKNM